jgi:hypothetical protein
VGAPTVQPEVVLSNTLQVVTEESMRTIECQGEDIRNFNDRMKRGMFLGAEEIRKQVLGSNFPPLVRSILLFVRGFDLAIQLAEMRYGISNLTTWDRSVHDEGSLLKKSQHRSCGSQQMGESRNK